MVDAQEGRLKIERGRTEQSFLFDEVIVQLAPLPKHVSALELDIAFGVKVAGFRVAGNFVRANHHILKASGHPAAGNDGIIRVFQPRCLDIERLIGDLFWKVGFDRRRRRKQNAPKQ